MLVHHGLEKSCALWPDKTALVCADRRLTYAAIDAMADRLANALIAFGVGRRDRVAIYLPNSVEAVAGIFATLKAGGVFVVINRGTKTDKLGYILGNCRAAVLLTDPKALLDGTVAAAFGRCPALKQAIIGGGHRSASPQCASFDEIQTAFPASRPRERNIDQDLACLVYTSGSTGEPKGVMCAHSNVVFAAGSIIQYLENRPSDIVLNVQPLSFDYGLYQLLMTFTFGGTLVLESSFAYPAEVLKRIPREGVTGFPGVPTLFATLLQMDLSGFDLSSLRYITNTAAALPPSHIQELRRKFPGVTLYSMYGLTETKRTLYLPPEQLDLRPGSVGIPIPGTEVWLEDEDGHRLEDGGIGELVVRGRHVMRGYWEAPQATAERFRPGPLPGEQVCYSGDLFRMDQEGYLYFVGRKDDIIKSRGEKVAPKEIENVLYALKGVAQAAVVGVPDPILGQAIKAIVVQDGSKLRESDVLAHCRTHLEDFMVPKYVEFRSDLPKTSSGKIAKKELAGCAA